MPNLFLKSRRIYIWLPLILLLKGIALYIFFCKYNNFYPEKLNGIAFISNDFNELIEPSNQLVTNGIYSLEKHKNPYIGRLPGYAFPFLIFRYIFSENISLQLLIISQCIFSAISIFYLGIMSERISQKKILFILTIILFSLFPFYLKEELATISTSFSVSAFIIHLYFIFKFLNNQLKKNLFYSGLFLLWLILLRPFTLVFYVPSILLIGYLFQDKLKHIITYTIIFLSPLVIFESFWILRNYINTQKIIPLQDAYVPGKDYGYTDGCGMNCTAKYSVVEIRKLVSAWGGNSTWYIPGTEMHWFLSYKPLDFKNYTFVNKNIFVKGFNRDSLINLKKDLAQSFNEKLHPTIRKKIDDKIVSKCKKFKKAYANNKPIEYYIISHLKRLKNFLIVNPTQDWPGPSFRKSSLLYKSYKFISILLFYLSLLSVVVFGFLKIKNKFGLLCFMYALSLIFVFSFLVELSSVLYFSTGLVCGWICFLFMIKNYHYFFIQKSEFENMLNL